MFCILSKPVYMVKMFIDIDCCGYESTISGADCCHNT